VDDWSDEDRAWFDLQMERSRIYHERLAIIIDVQNTATDHEADCDVCAHILTMIPRDVPEFVAAFDRAGPVLDDQRVTIGGIWSFPRRDFLWHESRHGE
jgi:hypothetical protein